ncbi:response regulator [Paenibacillus nasutitermitis]|uniref:Two-component system, response regulator YesN n=1 Tax=Paenibacillus nasutitermitis TaxID=1652958 RepID=A0A916ZK65_9BACL|nr:response regulator [Paenibacillus nasutitermitis]GGE02013.1 hypothetical protein GCM10010911_71280 [Paenibacillus nasutitermitis]
MIRIAVIDDEELIRLGLAKIIGRIDPAYQVVGVWSSGREALGHLEETEVDLILTDIRMPQMDGLEMIAELRRRGSTARVAILSGYSDFSYAREALRHNVEDYLLKPVNQDELMRLLARVAEKVEEEQSRQPFDSESLIELILGANKERIAKTVWQGACDQLDELHLFRNLYTVILLHSEPECGEQRIGTIVAAWKREHRILIREGKLAAVILAIRPGDHADTPRELAMTMLGKLPIASRVRIGTSGIYTGGSQLHKAYREASDACQYAWYEADSHPVAAYSPGFAHHPDEKNLKRLLRNELIPALAGGDQEGAEAALQLWLKEAQLLRLRWEVLESAAEELILKIDTVSEEDQSGPFHEGPEPKPDQYADFQAYAAGLSLVMEQRLQHAKEARHASRAVERIKLYLHEQYKEELDLHKLAEHVHLTPSYLSKLFKGETGETITDFAISVRIHHAKRLLREAYGLKTYEVGEQVGYPDPAYFTKVFKRMTGKTPKEFRDSVR